jgi:hypothetical protein
MRFTRSLPSILCILISLLVVSITLGFQVRQEPSRFDDLAIYDPSVIVGVTTLPIASLDTDNSYNIAWKSFLTAHGERWKIYLDGRSGAPLLVEGKGIPLIPGAGNNLSAPDAIDLEYLEISLREFIDQNTSLLLANNAELILNEDATVKLTPEVWQIAFDRSVSGIPVRGERYSFIIGHGNIVSFGATRWSRINTSPTPTLDADAAYQYLAEYMQLTDADQIEHLSTGERRRLRFRSCLDVYFESFRRARNMDRNGRCPHRKDSCSLR